MRAGYRIRRVMGLAVAGLVLGATPAAADAAKPGDHSSEVTAVEPDVEGIDVQTAGGDAFLELSVDEGVEVLVLGYEGEPYLRFASDGTVTQNTNSPATFINAERFGTNELAPEELQGVDVTTLEPQWEEVATGGTYAWHDHRTHFMGGQRPGSGTIDWVVPLEVDGESVEVVGMIRYEGTRSPLPWLALALLVAVAVVLGAGRLPDTAGAAVLVVVALGATVVAWIGFADQPPDTGASVVPTVVGAVALVLAALALALARFRTVGLLAAGVFLATWGVFRLAVLSHPVLPTTVPFGLERLVTALALGVGVGAVATAFRSGAFTNVLLPLTDE